MNFSGSGSFPLNDPVLRTLPKDSFYFFPEGELKLETEYGVSTDNLGHD